MKSLLGNKYVQFVIFIRVIGYIVILYFPLEGILLSIVLDMLDWHILSWGNIPQRLYHVLDKPLDYIQYLFMIPPLLNTPIFTHYIIFLIWRTIGHIIYTKFKQRFIFIIFPNIAEYLAIVYLLSEKFALNIDSTSFSVILGIVIFKIINEVWIHYLAKGTSYKWAYNIRGFLSRKV
ncbi:hypothetical protein HYV12_02145 [Candidatus Dojkabacteria bacterium]|nr:hypothetical protein [Candidatus Dojkabacteria bacterium]